MQKRRVGPQMERNERPIALDAKDKFRIKRRVTQMDRKFDNNNSSKIKAVVPREGSKARFNATIPLGRSNQNQKAVAATSNKVQRVATDTVASSQRNLTDSSPYPNPSPTSYPTFESSLSTSESPLFISLGDIKEATAEILRSYSGVVIIANVGAWYNSRERFRKELPVNYVDSLFSILLT